MSTFGLPGVYTNIQTLSRGVSIPGGSRIAAIMGEGSRSETIVTSALGGGLDGLDPTYTTTNGADGRHFKLSIAPVQANRTTLYRNGIPLVGLEQLPSNLSFSNLYDYRIDPATGEIEMQRAHLVDQGGSYWLASGFNFGSGSIQNLTLVDVDAPSETWTIKCTSVQRDGYGVVMANTAKFVAFGTVSGSVLDGYGNPIVWVSNNTTVSNGILSFSILQNPLQGANDFKEGDAFTIKVSSGVLLKNDTLTANYVAVTDINDPTLYTSMVDIAARYGTPSLTNRLSLGCQLAFANGAPGIMTLQTAPALPRRTSYALDSSVKSTSSNIEDYIFPLPANVSPDVNSSVHFFVTNPTTKVEKQVLPNKYAFYTLTDTSVSPSLHDFVFGASTYAYDYTVINRPLVTKYGIDGVLTDSITIPGQATLSSASVMFGAGDVGSQIKLFDTVNAINTGIFNVISDSNGTATIQWNLFAAETGVTVQLYNGATLVSTITDGQIIPNGNDGTKAVLQSATNLNNLGAITTAVISASSNPNNNIGTFLNAGVVLGNNNQITIKKYFVTENPVTFEVLSGTDTGSFIVVNQSVVPVNNALRVTAVDGRDASFYDAGWINALAALETVSVDIVVPLPTQTITAIFQNALSHCRTMSNFKNKLERELFIGAIQGLTPDNVLGNKLAAVEDIGILEGIQGETVSDVLSGNTEDLANYSVSNAYGNTYRAVYFYPDQIVASVGGQNVFLDGFYQAAAAAGYLSGLTSVAMPLTNKTLSGYSILKTRKYSRLVLEQLVNAGITVCQPAGPSGALVIKGVTTTQSGFPEEQEISIIFIRDLIAKQMRAGFAGFVGLPGGDILGALTSRANSMLISFVNQKLITKADSLVIVEDPSDPTQWNVSVSVQPVYPVDVINVVISVGVI